VGVFVSVTTRVAVGERFGVFVGFKVAVAGSGELVAWGSSTGDKGEAGPDDEVGINAINGFVSGDQKTRRDTSAMSTVRRKKEKKTHQPVLCGPLGGLVGGRDIGSFPAGSGSSLARFLFSPSVSSF
jgi:hypothetical protein